MALPARQDSPSTPGTERRQRTADFAYLNQGAANDESYQPSHEQFKTEAYKENERLLQPVGIGRQSAANTPITQVPTTEYTDTPTYTSPRRGVHRRLRKLKKQAKPVQLAAKASARLRASSINGFAFAWMGFLWLFWQVPIAFFSIVFLGLVNFVDVTTTYVKDEDASWFSNAISWTTAKVSKAALSVIESVMGVDLADATFPIYLLLGLIILGIGLVCLLVLFFQYTIGRLKPLSGTGAGLKIGLFMLAIVGYATPIANLLPWTFLWMAAVWYYPR